jgi:hypothetical protein
MPEGIRNMMNDKIRADWSSLTDKEKVAVQGYMKSGNKLAAYKLAYFPDGVPEGKSFGSLQTACYKVWKRPKIKVIIDQIHEQSIKRANIQLEETIDENVDDLLEVQKEVDLLQIDALWVLKRAALLADFNINKFIKVSGGDAVYDFSTATDDDWYCIQEYVTDSSFVKGEMGLVPVEKVRLKSYDKLRALELVGKHINVGAFKDKLEISGDEDSPIQMITRQIVKAK